jgi:hypothetical protein
MNAQVQEIPDSWAEQAREEEGVAPLLGHPRSELVRSL